MTSLVIVVVLLVAVSFFCSVLESVILSVTGPYIEAAVEKQRRSGVLLKALKDKINDPISSILTLNTISNTAGAAIAGSLALQVFGDRWVALFSGVLTLIILVFAEIIPKTIGANYWKTLAPAAAWSLHVLVIVLKPIVVPVNLIAKLVARGKPGTTVTREEVLSAVRLGRLQGALNASEFELVDNLLRLKKTPIKDIKTPRTVVYSLAPDRTVGSAFMDIDVLHFSRIPLYDKEEGEMHGIVLRRDIILKVAQDQPDVVLKDLAMPPIFIPESLSVYELFDRLITRRAHMAIVLDEFGDYAGIATLEDAVEALLGREIVDESDRVVDMRKLARQRRREKFKGKGPGIEGLRT